MSKPEEVQRHKEREFEPVEHKKEEEEWSKGDRHSGYYQKSLDESKRNPLAAHGDGPMNKVLDPEEMPWEESPHGRLKHVLNEDIAEGLDFPGKGVDMYIQDIPAGSKSGIHRHMSEELVFVLEGEGHDLHWDPTVHIEDEFEWEWPDEPMEFEWAPDDVVYIPTNTAHQHVNDSDEPARILCCQARAYKSLGFGFEDLEQFETAPEWDGPENTSGDLP